MGEPVPLNPEDTVLIVIDAQQMMKTENYAAFFKSIGLADDDIRDGLAEMYAYQSSTLANIELLLKVCREKGIRPIHIHVQSYLRNAADTGTFYKRIGLFCPPGAESTDFFPQAAPEDNEIVLSKTCSSIHIGTPIDRVLRNLHIKNIIVAGFYTDQCVGTSVRDLTDLGYRVELIKDACAAFCPSRHEAELTGLAGTFCSVEKTVDFLDRAKSL
jgi:nicotinamidase-related amidase